MEEPPANKFYGLSSLRAKEKAELPKTAQAKAMEEYLKRYTEGAAGPTDVLLLDAQHRRSQILHAFSKNKQEYMNLMQATVFCMQLSQWHSKGSIASTFLKRRASLREAHMA